MDKVNYGAAFGYFLKDKSWLKKFVVATLLVFTIVGITPVLGWMIEITRRVQRGEESELPGWTDFWGLWKTGFKYWLVNLVWLLPVILSILVVYLPLIFANSIDPNLLLTVIFAVLCCVLVFITFYSAVIIFLLPSAMGILAGTGSLGQAINPLNAWKVARLDLGAHAIVFVIIGLGLMTIISVIVPLTLFLGLPPLIVYTGMVMAHYAGQLYRLHQTNKP